MKQKIIGLSQRYAAALRKHLKQRSGAGLSAALGLGRQAVALGLETLELVRTYYRIPNANLRRRLFDLAKALANYTPQ